MNILIGTVVLFGVSLWFVWRLGRDRLPEALARAGQTMVFALPRICIALVGAKFFAELLPQEQIQALFGTENGLRALAMASALGIITPGGGVVCFAIAAAAMSAGASTPAVMTYVTAWGLFSLTRTLAYELPMMGTQATRLRFAVSWPLPFVVGCVALILYAI